MSAVLLIKNLIQEIPEALIVGCKPCSNHQGSLVECLKNLGYLSFFK